MTKFIFMLSPALLSIALFNAGCAENPADNVPAAKVNAPDQQSSKGPQNNPPHKGKGAPNNGSATNSSCKADLKGDEKKLSGQIIFVGSKVTGNHVNEFSNWVGKATDTGVLSTTQLSFCVNTKDIVGDVDATNPGNAKFEKKLRSKDFFDTRTHPTATFESTLLKRQPKGSATHEVTGNMTIKGITKSITFPATINSINGQFTMNAEFSINRKDFNITYRGKTNDLIRDDVLLKLNFKGQAFAPLEQP